MRVIQVFFLFVFAAFGLRGLAEVLFIDDFSKAKTSENVKVNLYKASEQETLASGNWTQGGGHKSNS